MGNFLRSFSFLLFVKGFTMSFLGIVVVVVVVQIGFALVTMLKKSLFLPVLDWPKCFYAQRTTAAQLFAVAAWLLAFQELGEYSRQCSTQTHH